MKRIRFWTGIFMLFGLVLILIWEIIAFSYLENATLSVYITDLDKVSPLVGYSVTALFGILIGHWFIPAEGSDE